MSRVSHGLPGASELIEPGEARTPTRKESGGRKESHGRKETLRWKKSLRRKESAFAFAPNPPPDYRMVGRVFGVLGALASTGYTFVIATSVGGGPFTRIGMSQGGVLVLYWFGWLSLGWIIGWAGPRIAGRMGSATVGALISSGAFISAMILSPAPAWPTYIIPFGVIGMGIGALMWESNG